MTQLEQIKAEIEKLILIAKNNVKNENVIPFKLKWSHQIDVCKYLLNYLNSLPQVPVSEEEQFEKFKKSWYLEGYADGKYGRSSQFSEEPASEDLEEVADNLSSIYAGKENEGSPDPKRDKFAFYIGFKNGAKWQLEQMMKDTVEARVISNEGISFPVSNEIYRLGLEEGDKVKLIFIKED